MSNKELIDYICSVLDIEIISVDRQRISRKLNEFIRANQFA